MLIKEPLWTSAELAATCGGLHAQPWYADGVQTDSRDVLPGDIFVALEGAVQDGHQYVAEAFRRGAVAALVSDHVPGFDLGDPRLVHVPDTLEALRLMAAHARNRAPVQTIGVTGSAGKTSVVQALRKALDRSDQTHASIKSYNNHVGVPLSMARMPRAARYGVFELGMSAPGEVRSNVTLVRPDVAVITTVGAAHTAAFDGEADVARAKAEIFEGLKPGGVAVVNVDHAHADILLEAAKAAGATVVAVSVTGQGDVHPLRMTEHHNCTCLTADVNGTVMTYKVSQPGREWVLNSLLVLAAVQAVGGDMGHAALSLASLEAEPGRGRVHELRFPHASVLLLDDSYNANPVSLRAALRRLSLAPVSRFGRRIAVLADMQELGVKSAEIHMALGADLKAFGVTRVFALGPQMAAMARVAGVLAAELGSVTEAEKALIEDLRDGDVIMVKGANSAGLSTLVRTLVDASAQDDFDDVTRMVGVAHAL